MRELSKLRARKAGRSHAAGERHAFDRKTGGLTEAENEERRSCQLPFSVMRMDEVSVYYLCVPFTKHFEQPISIVQSVNGIALIRRFNGIFKPVRDAWIGKDLVESHSYSLRHSRLDLDGQCSCMVRLGGFKKFFSGHAGKICLLQRRVVWQ